MRKCNSQIFILKYSVTFCLVCGVELPTDVTFMDFVGVCLTRMVKGFLQREVLTIVKRYKTSCGYLQANETPSGHRSDICIQTET